jgi:hypothetical protein
MVGRNPLLVAKEHGHRISTMLSVYAAWAEGAVEADIVAIREAMNRTARRRPSSRSATPAPAPAFMPPPEAGRSPSREASAAETPSDPFGSGLVSEPLLWMLKSLKVRENFNGKGGTRTLDPGIMSAAFASK